MVIQMPLAGDIAILQAIRPASQLAGNTFSIGFQI